MSEKELARAEVLARSSPSSSSKKAAAAMVVSAALVLPFASLFRFRTRPGQ